MSIRVYTCLFVSIRVYFLACLSVLPRVYFCVSIRVYFLREIVSIRVYPRLSVSIRVYPCLFVPCLSVSISVPYGCKFSVAKLLDATSMQHACRPCAVHAMHALRSIRAGLCSLNASIVQHSCNFFAA